MKETFEAHETEPEGRRKFELLARWRHLKIATTHVEEVPRVGKPPTKIYRSPSAVAALSVGNVFTFLPKILDSVLVRLHFSAKFGMVRRLCNPPNLLRPPRTITKERWIPIEEPDLGDWNPEWGEYPDVPESRGADQRAVAARKGQNVNDMPDKLIAISTLDKMGLLNSFGRGENALMKFGSRTGFSKFHVNEHRAFLDGREALEIISLSGVHAFSAREIVDGGDSSAPVFDQEGTLHGMISAKSTNSFAAYMIAISDIIQAAKEMGIHLSLA